AGALDDLLAEVRERRDDCVRRPARRRRLAKADAVEKQDLLRARPFDRGGDAGRLQRVAGVVQREGARGVELLERGEIERHGARAAAALDELLRGALQLARGGDRPGAAERETTRVPAPLAGDLWRCRRDLARHCASLRPDRAPCAFLPRTESAQAGRGATNACETS